MKHFILILYLIFSVSLLGWSQTSFMTDSCLMKLVEEALSKNADVRTTQLALTQAEAMLRSAKLTYLPSFAFSPSATLNKVQGKQLEKSYALPITMEWEVNLGAGQKYEKAMAQACYEEARQWLDYTKVQLVATVANAYYTLVMIDQQIVITKQSLENQESSLAAMRAFKEVGKMTNLAVHEAEAACLNTQISLSELEIQAKKSELALMSILNRSSGTINRSKWSDVKCFYENADSIVDLQQLSNRPDVKAAEYALFVACGSVDVAKAAFYPSLRISADAGWTNNVGEIVNPAKLLLHLIASLTQPIFSRGTLKAQKRVAIAQREQAEIAFEKALLIAGNEVNDALHECSIMKQRLPLRQKQVEVSRKAFDDCHLLLNYSQSVSYLDVLMAQNTYLMAQLQQTADWLQMQQASINLYKATCPQP